MYCFVEAGWEIFSRSFAAEVISLAFSGPFFGPFDGSGIPLPVQKNLYLSQTEWLSLNLHWAMGQTWISEKHSSFASKDVKKVYSV